MNLDRRQRRNTNGRPSQATFWVRRVVALLILAILVALVVFVVRFAWAWMQAADDTQQLAQAEQTTKELVTQPTTCDMANIAY